MELKKLENMLEKQDADNLTETNNDCVDYSMTPSKNGEKPETSTQPWTPMSFDIVDIPIPSESNTPPRSTNSSFLPVNPAVPAEVSNNITVAISVPTVNTVPPVPMEITPPPASLTPTKASSTVVPVPSPVPLPNSVPATPPPSAKKAPATDNSKSTLKHKMLTKLPMPPGIKQADLEAIESPPSRTPSPVPPVKPKTPPRKSGIMNLPMPPGKLIALFQNLPTYIFKF